MSVTQLPHSKAHLERTPFQQRLTAAYRRALPLAVDDDSRYIFFSDLHRGDGGPADAFAPNSHLFLHVLRCYFHRGYTYVEVGDGDDLWQVRRFATVRQTYGALFDLLHDFDARRRLFILYGNHDCGAVDSDEHQKDGIRTYESLTLHHRSGGGELFVVHGHQADRATGPVTRAVNRFLVTPLQRLMRGNLSEAQQDAAIRYFVTRPVRYQLRRYSRVVERRLLQWSSSRRVLTLCGHTHRARFAHGSLPAYFNCGSGIVPGAITGIELVEGHLRSIRWTAAGREVLADARLDQLHDAVTHSHHSAGSPVAESLLL